MADLSLNIIWNEARKTLDDLTHLAMDRTVRLAVTGLNQSGKTVFITSLIHQLLNANAGVGLPFFQVVNSGRLRGAKIILQPDMDIPFFRYDQFIQPLLSARPNWPNATDGISEIRLALRFQPDGMLRKSFSSGSTLYLDIIDYPGEWLLDLPMLDQDFQTWSQQIFQLCHEEPRRALSAKWRQYLSGLKLFHIAQEETLRQATQLYTEFLHACKSKEVGLNFLQPGRFFVPGEFKDTPLLTFCPLEIVPGPVTPGSIQDIMTQRFESYKERVVGQFFKKHFSSFDRQIVLIDLLKALNYGPWHFADTRNALTAILESFNYGQSNIISRLFKPKIDKLLFAATKVDHVAANQHHNLERLVNRLVIKPANDAVYLGVEVKTMAISSMVCTETVVREHEGRRLSFVQGTPKGRDQEILLFPGEIPENLPTPADWAENRFNFLEFKPRPAMDAESGQLPHIRLDQALEFLLGDKLL
ncbi:MAG: YcjX family protein [Magnetococcus sp. DMHC-6]